MQACTWRRKILWFNFRKWGTELCQCGPNFFRVLFVGIYPKVDIAGRPWDIVYSYCVGADQEKLNVVFL